MKFALGAVVILYAAVSGGCNQQPGQESAPVQKLTSNGQQPVNASAGSDGKGTTPRVDLPSSEDRIVARINGQPITMQEFLPALIESHGLQILMGLVQLDLARQDARESHVTVSPEDIRHEQDQTLLKMFKDADVKEQDQLEEAERKGETEKAAKLRNQIRGDRETLLAQYLDNQHFSRTEFDLKVQINAYLRKAADRGLAGKITDDMVETEFGVEYGATAQVRFIQLANMQEVAEARQRLKNGEDFGDVAETMSHNGRTAAAKGLMPTFSRQTEGIPETFKQAAFTLQKGQVSDTLSLGGNFYILKLEQKFAPKAVKFENVKESLRKSMYERLAQVAMEQFSVALGKEVVAKLQVQDPQLKKIYDKFQADQKAVINDRQKLDEQLKKEREAHIPAAQPAATQPVATEPAAAPASAPATQP